MNYFLGIDIGSQSSKGVLVDENGKIIEKHIIPHQMDMPHPGHFEQDADRIWWGEFCEISRTLIKDSGVSPSDIKAVGHSATSPCVLFIDEQHKPLRPGILYGIDTRAYIEQEELTRLIGAKALLETGGCALSSQSVAPKIMWVRKNEPQVWQKTKKILSANGYISFRLTGRFTQNTYDAVGYTGLFNIFTMDWINENIPYVCPKEYLPELVSPSQSIGRVNAEASKECGLVVGTPVLPGIADAAAESLCAGVSQQKEMMLMMGTSVFFVLRTKKLHQTDKFWPSNFLKPDEYVLTGGTSNCGSATTWFIETFAKDVDNVYTILINEANEVEISQESPLIIPYFAGERTPIFDPYAKAIFFGVTLNHKRGDLFKALLEGIAYTIKDNISEIKKLAPVEKIYAIGGGVKNPILLQLIADICQIKVIIPDIDIGAAYGDAYLAACLLNPNINLQDWVGIGRHILPSADCLALYEERYALYKKLYQSTRFLIKEQI